MTIFLVLDALLLLLIALFMPIGYWRGPVKELCVTLGLLLGMQLVDYWARPWGRDLADMTDLTNDGGAFVVAMCFLIASTFIIGYGVGAALGPAWPSFQARLLGAGIAAFNGMLLLAFALQQVRLFLLSDENEESLEDAFVARFLLDQMGWVVLAVAVVAVPAILYILLSGRRAYELIEQPEAWEAPETTAYPPRTPRVPRAPVAYVDADGNPDVDVDNAPYKADPAARRPRTDAAEPSRRVTVATPQATAEPAQRPRERAATVRGDEPVVVVSAPAQGQQSTGSSAPASAAADADWDSELPTNTDPQMPLVAPQPPPSASSASAGARADAGAADAAAIPAPPTVPSAPEPPRTAERDDAAPAAAQVETGRGAARRLRRPRGAAGAAPTAGAGARAAAGASAGPAPRASEPPASDDLPEGWQRCRTCHAVLPPGVGICPNCGTVR